MWKSLLNKRIFHPLRMSNIRKYGYDSDGKTTAHILNNDTSGRLTVNSYSKIGFRLNTGLFVFGPMVIFPRSVLSWNVYDDFDINEESLSLFTILEPKIDVLVLGLSEKLNHKSTQTFMKRLDVLRKNKINFEVLATENAVTIFNFLALENRFVAGAFIPPKEIIHDDFDFHVTNKMFEGKDDYLIGDDIDTKQELLEQKQAQEELEKMREISELPKVPSLRTVRDTIQKRLKITKKPK